MVQIEVKIPTGFRSILAEQSSLIAFVNCILKRFAFANIFAANVDITCIRIHRERSDQRTLDQGVRIMTHDFAVFTGAWLRFIGVNHQISRTPIAFLRHKGPFETRWETRSTTTTQARGLHLIHDPITTVLDNLSCAVPMPSRLGAF